MGAIAELPDIGAIRGIKPQAKLLYEILAEGGEHSLPSIRREFERRGVWCLETSLSARVRELNAWFRGNGHSARITHRYERPGSYTTLYRIETKGTA